MYRIQFVCLIGLAGLLAGCGSAIDKTARLEENLHQADLIDGQEDHVVGKCYSCALAMDGSTDFSFKYKDYTCNFCSQACKDHFETKAEKIVAKTEMPPVSETP